MKNTFIKATLLITLAVLVPAVTVGHITGIDYEYFRSTYTCLIGSGPINFSVGGDELGVVLRLRGGHIIWNNVSYPTPFLGEGNYFVTGGSYKICIISDFNEVLPKYRSQYDSMVASIFITVVAAFGELILVSVYIAVAADEKTGHINSAEFAVVLVLLTIAVLAILVKAFTTISFTEELGVDEVLGTASNYFEGNTLPTWRPYALSASVRNNTLILHLVNPTGRVYELTELKLLTDSMKVILPINNALVKPGETDVSIDISAINAKKIYVIDYELTPH